MRINIFEVTRRITKLVMVPRVMSSNVNQPLRGSTIAATTALIVLISTGHHAVAQNIRTAAHRYGMPLEEQVSCPDRETVRFPPGTHGIVFDWQGEATAEGFIDYALDVSDLGLVFLADETTSFLTQNRSWISTRVSGFVEDVMWSRGLKTLRYSRLAIELADGAMRINGCEVITGAAIHIAPGRRYLVFLNQLDGPVGIPTVNPILISENGQLERTFQPSPRQEALLPFLKGASLGTVHDRIRVEPSRHVCSICFVFPSF